VITVVCNDAAFGQEVQLLRMAGLPDDIARYPAVSFAALADSIGMDAITIDSAASLTGLRTRLAAAAGPLLIDCKISAAVCGEHAGLVGRLGR
jgi:thiamine pyrophosphate-dependent acetolactate synthase large subunit-like protein